ncbi:hypothetical protein ACJX0J_009996, partial [Zea mays]
MWFLENNVRLTKDNLFRRKWVGILLVAVSFNDQNHQYLLKPTDLKQLFLERQLTDIILLLQQPFHPSDHAILACGKLEDACFVEYLDPLEQVLVLSNWLA